ncbi:unnamed protein product [Arabidopsis lyrata]|nr:unnamed protein product [Arabidopsis lyrata]
MTSNRQQNTNNTGEADTNFPTETSTRSGDNFKWNPIREIIFLELYDKAIAMNNYRLKDPTPLGKEFLVDNFNEKFNLNINYRFFKEKLDQLKKKYKKYVQLMDNTCITVDPVTHQITASNSWWKDQEVCKIVHAFQRQPPQLWDVMQRCFRLYNVKSQSQYSVNQRREEIMNEGITNNQGQTYSETYGDEIPESQVPETQENEEVYRVNIDDETRHGWSSCLC